jgi:hypothetical protein
LSKLPASSIGHATEEAAPAPPPAPDVVAEEPREEERGRRRLRRLARRLRPGPQPLFLLLYLGLAMWMFAPAWSSPTTTTL